MNSVTFASRKAWTLLRREDDLSQQIALFWCALDSAAPDPGVTENSRDSNSDFGNPQQAFRSALFEKTLKNPLDSESKRKPVGRGSLPLQWRSEHKI